MAGHVCQRFLGGAEYLIFKSRGERSVSAADVDVDRKLFSGRLFGEASEASGQSVLCGIGAQIPDAATCFCEPLAHVLLGAIYLLACRSDLRLNEELGSELELHGHADEALREGVVNFAGHPITLRKDCLEL